MLSNKLIFVNTFRALAYVIINNSPLVVLYMKIAHNKAQTLFDLDPY